MNNFKKMAIVIAGIVLPCVATATEYDVVNIQSTALNETRQYQVSLPANYAESTQRFPVIYRLDGAENIPLMRQVLGRMHKANAAPNVIIVAIENTERLRDMYPTVNQDPNGPVGVGGGADKFLKFIEQELIPDVEKRYRTHSTRIIAGASAAGVFSLYALQQRPGLFNAHIAYSPAVWWNNGAMVERTKKWLKTEPKHSAYVYMNMGNEGQPMRPYYDRLLAELSAVDNPQVRFVIDEHPGVSHGLTSTAGIFKAYQSFFISKEFAREKVTADMQVIDNYYRQLGEQWGTDQTPPENTVRQLGYFFDWQQQPDLAMALYKHNMSHHPQSPDAISGVVYGYEGQNNFEQALYYAEKALKVASEDHPYYNYFVENLARLKEKVQNSKAEN